MVSIHRLVISPPVLNSSSPWASDKLLLEKLYNCIHTGAVTTRTAVREHPDIDCFSEDPVKHKVVFASHDLSSLNSYGYSPHPLKEYILWIKEMLAKDPASKKPFIVSITSSSPTLLSSMVDDIQELRQSIGDHQGDHSRIAVELNTSCPNIPDHPPPSYSPEKLLFPLLETLAVQYKQDPTLTIGIKLPPYVYGAQFADVLATLSRLSYCPSGSDKTVNPIAFLSCTNTLGNSIFLTDQAMPSRPASNASSPFALPPKFGGLAGQSIHPLALGNVHSFAEQLKKHPDPALRGIKIIGIGGVHDADSARRMFQVGASAVACATALGSQGVSVFEKLEAGAPKDDAAR
ncbi:FMN-linked oxidoreductase [Sistotremastrum niveocremeum HHB9708]|uniref:Dihydroorotate oxidase n=1 Tax=Sistotremastrum niveocremeum HHB9708 TaxID=1314777 RepID=A0A164R6R9_9AGAM|nr:FMN-linked oxidoreductase [Sistotremastrum niveocremeum HHB9708]